MVIFLPCFRPGYTSVTKVAYGTTWVWAEAWAPAFFGLMVELMLWNKKMEKTNMHPKIDIRGAKRYIYLLYIKL